MEPATRRHLSVRQAQTVANLVEAAVAELAATGYSALTVRNVAKRAGVAPATAYTYFASKEHLIAEVYWRRYSAAEPATPDRRRSPANRAVDVLMDFALVVAKSPNGFRTWYESIAERIVAVDAPGSTSANLHSLPYVKCQRPMYPLEADTAGPWGE